MSPETSESSESLALSPEKLADQLGVATRTLANWRSRGVGPSFVKIANRVVYLPDDVKSWLDSCERVECAGV